MRFSYSRVECFAQCPKRYDYQYNQRLKTVPDQQANNALYLGTALHLGLETGDTTAAVENYKSNYYVVTDDVINEVIKLEYVIPKALKILPYGECEIEISTDNFIGFIDRLCQTFVDDNGVQHWDLYDYKYTTNGERYKTSKQLHIYKYYYELLHPNNVIDHLYYLIIGKVSIRQKKNESIFEFRQRLKDHLEASEIKFIEVNYDKDSITQFQTACKQLETVDNFPKNETRLCSWCQYEPLCKRGEDWMIL